MPQPDRILVAPEHAPQLGRTLGLMDQAGFPRVDSRVYVNTRSSNDRPRAEVLHGMGLICPMVTSCSDPKRLSR